MFRVSDLESSNVNVLLLCKPFTICIFQTILVEMNEMKATYLFQKDKNYHVSYDTGDKTIQCGRHNDIFKLWLTWRSKGMDGYAQKIDSLFENAR